MASVQEHHWWFVARRQILAALIQGMALPFSAKILEIGVGTGGNLAMLNTFGQIHAMEYDEAARKIAESMGVCPVFHGGLPEPVPFGDREFDLVCMFDVLEHIDADVEALRRAALLVKPCGCMLVTVPAYTWLWTAHDDAHHHFRRYSAGGFQQCANAAGLKVSRLGYFNSLLFPVIASVRIAQKLFGDRGGTANSLPNPLLNKVLTNLFGLERHVVPLTLFPFGTSVIAVLKVDGGSQFS